ncbi:hypothetical protein AKG09_05155 [Neisseria sp. 83E34]|nr:hypothetical protein AKG09_05155 [Neisseria sp. 83E34]
MYLYIFLIYVLVSLYFKWLLSWGGAERIEGWLAGFLINLQSTGWDTEQIRFYALLSWIAWTVFCVVLLLAS